MNGAGNDFVCLDNRSGKIKLSRKQIERLCHRQTGIGADGMLLIEKSPRKEADFRMRYYNSDGGEASMCGNGARCFAKFAKMMAKWKKPQMSFLTGAGIVRAVFVGENVRITLTPPSEAWLNQAVELKSGVVGVHSIDTGVPHAVLFVDDIEKVDVKNLGHEIRWHEAFQPKGTNVNFAQVLGASHVRLRTYERGVEDETLACGTGMVATALLSHLVHGFNPPIKLRVQGGDTLVVNFKKDGDTFSDVTLLGPAEVTFKGETLI